MIRFDTVKVALPLKTKFKVAKGETEIKTNLLTILNNRYNGEASGSVHLGPSVEKIEVDLARGIEMLRSTEQIDLEVIKEFSKSDLLPAAKSAIVAALLNYLSGETDRYPWEIVSIGGPVGVKSSMTISIADHDEMVKAITESTHSIIKVKMGNEEDVMILDDLAKVVDKEIRVDANGGWSCAKAEEMIFNLAKSGVKVIEQPTDPKYISEWPMLKGRAKDVELIMDEGLNNLDDYNRMAQFFDGVNIKMEKCGGIIEGMAIARRARQDKKKVMLGCMVESSVGIAQSVYMSSQADYFDLDGPLLLKDDIADGIRYDRESIEVDREIIGGPKLKRDIVEKYISR